MWGFMPSLLQFNGTDCRNTALPWFFVPVVWVPATNCSRLLVFKQWENTIFHIKIIHKIQSPKLFNPSSIIFCLITILYVIGSPVCSQVPLLILQLRLVFPVFPASNSGFWFLLSICAQLLQVAQAMQVCFASKYRLPALPFMMMLLR